MADINIDIVEDSQITIEIADDSSGVEVEMVGQGPKGDPGSNGAAGPQGPQGPAGEGDMNASTYDPQEIADDAFARANHTGTQGISTITGLQTALDGKEPTKGADDNYVTDAEKAKLSNLSGTNTGDQDLSGYLLSVTAASTYEPIKGADDNYVTDAEKIIIGNTSGTNTGDQDLSGYTPTSSLGDLAFEDEITVADITATGTADNTTYLRGDGSWATPAGGSGAVDSVNGQTGVVVLDADDIDDTSTTHKYVTSSDLTNLSNLSGTNTGDQDLSSYLTSATAASTYEPLKGADDNYVTDAEKVVIGNTSGTNTGDQDLSGYVPNTRTVNGAALSSNITLDQDDIGDGTTYKQYSQTEKTKLSGVEENADVTDAGNVGSSIHGASGKTTPIDADTVALIDSAASSVLKKLTWANIKATLKSYFDTLYSTFDGAYSSLSGIPSTFSPSSHNNSAHSETYITASGVTYENLSANGDVGTGSSQVAEGNHNHSGVYQPVDSDLTAIASISPTNDDVIQRKSGSWTNRSMSQLKTDLSLTKSDVGLSNVTNDAQLPIAGGTLTGAVVAADHGTASTAQIINVCYGTSATPPTASTTTEGTLYVQYTP